MSDYAIETYPGEPTTLIIRKGITSARVKLEDGWLMEFRGSACWMSARDKEGVEEWRARRHGDVLRLIRRDLTVYEFDLRQVRVTEFKLEGDRFVARPLDR